MNEEREAAGEPRVRQPAQRRRRRDCARSTAQAVARRGLRAFTYQIVMPAGRGRSRRRRTTRRARAADGVGMSGRAALASAARASTRVIAFCRALARRAPRAAVRHRRRRHQARRPGAAGDARHDREVPALGRRVQVPGRAGDDAAHQDRRERRPHRRGDAVRGARAGAAERHDGLRWRRCTTSRKSRGATSAKATSSSSRRAATSSRRSLGPVLEARAARSARVADADRLPVLRQRARQARGRGRLALRERLVSGAHPPRPRSTSRRAGR